MKHLWRLKNQETFKEHRYKVGPTSPVIAAGDKKNLKIVPKRTLKIHYNPNMIIDNEGTRYLDYYATQTLFPQDKLEIISNGSFYESFKINGVEQAEPLVHVETDFGPVYEEGKIVTTPLTPGKITKFGNGDYFEFEDGVDFLNLYVAATMYIGEVCKGTEVVMASEFLPVNIEGNKAYILIDEDMDLSVYNAYYEIAFYSNITNTDEITDTEEFYAANSEYMVNVVYVSNGSGWQYTDFNWFEINHYEDIYAIYKGPFSFPIINPLLGPLEEDTFSDLFVKVNTTDEGDVFVFTELMKNYLALIGNYMLTFLNEEGTPYQYKLTYCQGGVPNHIYVDKNIGEFDVEAVLSENLYINTQNPFLFIDELGASEEYKDGIKGYGATPILHPHIKTPDGSGEFYNYRLILPCFEKVEFPNGIVRTSYQMFKEIPYDFEIILPHTLKEIAAGTFSDCTNITKIELPDSVETIGINAFYGCRTLERINLNGVKTISNSAFQYCTKLKEVKLPKVDIINNSTFYGCQGMESLLLGENVRSIDYNAFYDCRNLSEITCLSPIAPTINTYAFSSISSQGTLYYPKGADYSNFFEKLPDGWVDGTLNGSYFTVQILRDGVIDSTSNVTIGNIVGTFNASKNAYSFILPIQNEQEQDVFVNGEKCAHINVNDKKCFILIGDNSSHSEVVTVTYSVDNLNETKLHTNLTHKAMNVDGIAATSSNYHSFTSTGEHMVQYWVEGVSLPENAFYQCNNIISVQIPNTICAVGNYAFRYCNNLKSVEAPSLGHVGRNAFANCTSLESITITDLVSEYPCIERYAFYQCSNLKTLNVLGRIHIIETEAFYDCRNLEKINITNLESWCTRWNYGTTSIQGEISPFYYGAKLYLNDELVTDLQIPDTVWCISEYAFLGCSSITSVTIPDSVSVIEGFAFAVCPNLSTINLGNSLTTIRNNAFAGCEQLTSIVIPSSVTEIQKQAFWNCTSLTNVTISSPNITIGDNGFSLCDSLVSFTCLNEIPPTVHEDAFWGRTTNQPLTLYYPAGSDYSSLFAVLDRALGSKWIAQEI